MRNKIHFLLVGIILAALAFIACGCNSTGHGGSSAMGGGANPDQPAGAKLWAQNCARCHNYRSPESYSDAQWEVAMLHMRIRANLTAEEHRTILEFLKSAN